MVWLYEFYGIVVRGVELHCCILCVLLVMYWFVVGCQGVLVIKVVSAFRLVFSISLLAYLFMYSLTFSRHSYTFVPMKSCWDLRLC